MTPGRLLKVQPVCNIRGSKHENVWGAPEISDDFPVHMKYNRCCRSYVNSFIAFVAPRMVKLLSQSYPLMMTTLRFSFSSGDKVARYVTTGNRYDFSVLYAE